MSIEHYIIKSFTKDKAVFLKYYPLISHVKVDNMLERILKTINDYYLEFEEHSYISQDELIAYLDIINPHLKDRDVYVDIIKLIYEVDVSDSIAEVKIRQLIEKDAAGTTL